MALSQQIEKSLVAKIVTILLYSFIFAMKYLGLLPYVINAPGMNTPEINAPGMNRPWMKL